MNFWTDSWIVYSWLNKTLTTWNIFLTDWNWRNLNFYDNRVDIVSRGRNVGLKDDELWNEPT